MTSGRMVHQCILGYVKQLRCTLITVAHRAIEAEICGLSTYIQFIK